MAVLSALRSSDQEVPVLLLTAAIENPEVVEALRHGVCGIVLKETAPEVVVQAARRVATGGQWLDSTLIARALEGAGARIDDGRGAGSDLTPREREIVGMVALGLRNRAIAGRLGISEGTIKLHLHHVYEKLGLAGRFELVLYAQKHGL